MQAQSLSLSFPLSCQFLHQSIHISFSVVRDSSAHFQLVFWENFCNWRCIPDASSMERCTPHPPTPPTPYLWLCTAEFGLLIFLVEDFCIKIHQNHNISFIFLRAILCRFQYENSAGLIKYWLEKFPFSSIFQKSLKIYRNSSWMFCIAHQGKLVVLDFWLLEAFWFLIQSSSFVFLYDSVLEGSMFLDYYSFLLDFPNCSCILVYNSLL